MWSYSALSEAFVLSDVPEEATEGVAYLSAPHSRGKFSCNGVLRIAASDGSEHLFGVSPSPELDVCPSAVKQRFAKIGLQLDSPSAVVRRGGWAIHGRQTSRELVMNEGIVGVECQNPAAAISRL